MKKIVITPQLIGWGIFVAFEVIIKVLLYPFIIKHCEFQIALILVFLFIFVFRYLMILIYDKIKIDLFLIELLKRTIELGEEMTQSSPITRKILKFMKYGKPVVFCVLFCEPFIFVLFYRKGIEVWNNIPSLKLFLLYLGSTIFATTTIVGIVDVVLIAINFAKSLF